MATYGAEIHRLMRVIDAVREGKPDMPIQQAQVLFSIALRPGVTDQEIGQMVGLSQASVSRNTNSLGKWDRFKVPGLDLIESIEDPRERRRKISYLTKKGHARMTKVLSVLTGTLVTNYQSPTACEAWQYQHQ